MFDAVTLATTGPAIAAIKGLKVAASIRKALVVMEVANAIGAAGNITVNNLGADGKYAQVVQAYNEVIAALSLARLVAGGRILQYYQTQEALQAVVDEGNTGRILSQTAQDYEKAIVAVESDLVAIAAGADLIKKQEARVLLTLRKLLGSTKVLSVSLLSRYKNIAQKLAQMEPTYATAKADFLKAFQNAPDDVLQALDNTPDMLDMWRMFKLTELPTLQSYHAIQTALTGQGISGNKALLELLKIAEFDKAVAKVATYKNILASINGDADFLNKLKGFISPTPQKLTQFLDDFTGNTALLTQLKSVDLFSAWAISLAANFDRLQRINVARLTKIKAITANSSTRTIDNWGQFLKDRSFLIDAPQSQITALMQVIETDADIARVANGSPDVMTLWVKAYDATLAATMTQVEYDAAIAYLRRTNSVPVATNKSVYIINQADAFARSNAIAKGHSDRRALGGIFEDAVDGLYRNLNPNFMANVRAVLPPNPNLVFNFNNMRIYRQIALKPSGWTKMIRADNLIVVEATDAVSGSTIKVGIVSDSKLSYLTNYTENQEDFIDLGVFLQSQRNAFSAEVRTLNTTQNQVVQVGGATLFGHILQKDQIQIIHFIRTQGDLQSNGIPSFILEF